MNKDVGGDVILLYALGSSPSGRLTKTELLNFARYVDGDASSFLTDLDKLIEDKFVESKSNNLVDVVHITENGTKYLNSELKKVPVQIILALRKLNPVADLNKRLRWLEVAIFFAIITVGINFSPFNFFGFKEIALVGFGYLTFTSFGIIFFDIAFRSAIHLLEMVSYYNAPVRDFFQEKGAFGISVIQRNLVIITVVSILLALIFSGFFDSREKIWAILLVLLAGALPKLVDQLAKKKGSPNQPL